MIHTKNLALLRRWMLAALCAAPASAFAQAPLNTVPVPLSTVAGQIGTLLSTNGTFASGTALNSEVTRAQNAETAAQAIANSALPASGGTLTGTITGGALSGTSISTGNITATGTSTPRTPAARAAEVYNIMDYGAKCDGVTDDTAAINVALATAHSSTAYTSGKLVKVIGPAGGSTTKRCAVTQLNATGFNLFGNGSGLELDNLPLLCSGAGNICLDTIDSLNVVTRDVTFVGSSTNTPMIGYQEGSTNPATHACCIHENHDLQTWGNFTFAARYNAGTETDHDYGSIIRSSGSTSAGSIWTLGTVTGGSGYANGTYTGVPLTGGAGFDASANITVANGAVATVTMAHQGKDYTTADTLSAAAASLGGTGSGFSVPVASIANFAYVMDGDNHWGISSAFQTATWLRDHYYTLTQNTFFGGSIRYMDAATMGAPLWLGDVDGLHLYRTYFLNAAPSYCIDMFDDGASNVGNDSIALDIRCEGSQGLATFYLYGPNATPSLADFIYRDDYAEPQAIFANASNLTSITMNHAKLDVAHTWTPTVPLFTSPSLWAVTGDVYVGASGNWTAPSVFSGMLNVAGSVTNYGALPSTISSVSNIAPSGGVASAANSGTWCYKVTSPSQQFPTVSMSAPVGGSPASVAVTGSVAICTPGLIATAGSGYSANDTLTLAGATCAMLPQIKVATINAGAVATTTGLNAGVDCTALPTEPVSFTGGTGTGFTMTSWGWRPSVFSVNSPGSGFTTPPTGTYSNFVNDSGGNGTVTTTLNNLLSLSGGGLGSIILNSTGTNLGSSGATGSPSISWGALIDESGVRASLGSAYTVPPNTSLVRFTQSATVAASMVTLPTALADGQPIQFVNYAGAITALTFSPAVNGWANGSALAANSGLRIRWDATSAAWQREQ